MRKRKLKRAKHTRKTKRIQRTLMNRRKLTLKDYPKNNDARLDKKLRRDSVALRFYISALKCRARAKKLK